MSSLKNEYKNDNLHITVSREPGSKIKLHMTVSPLASQAAYKKAIKNVNKEVNMPGFRKGKAPDSYVVSNYKSHVDQEWKDVLVNTAFQEALELVKIYPFGKNSVQRPQVKDASPETGATIIIEYEAEPNVPTVNPEELSVKKISVHPVSQQDIDDVVLQVQLSHAKWDDAADQPIVEGDYVDLDIYNMDENFPICEGTRFAIQKGKMGSWLYNLLLGKKINDVVEGISELDHNHSETCNDPTHDHSHDHEFKPTRCKITIKTHQKATLPEVTDELALKAGAPNVDELMVRIKASLEKRATDQAKESQRHALEEQLAEKYVFDLPASLTKEEKEYRVSHAISHIQAEGMSKEDFEQKSKEISEKVSQDLDKAYRLFFLANQVAKDHKIDVSQDEIMQEFMSQMMSQSNTVINQNMQPEEIRSRLYSYVLMQKAKDFLIEHARQID